MTFESAVMTHKCVCEATDFTTYMFSDTWYMYDVVMMSSSSGFLGDRLDGYQKKKYVCKLIFIFLLGNDIEFGHEEAVNLLSSVRFSEKQIVSQRGRGREGGREGGGREEDREREG